MAKLTVTNNKIASVGLMGLEFQGETLNLNGAQTVEAGTLLARDSVSGKAVLFVPGGEVSKATIDGTFNLDPGDSFVVDVDNVGNATVTFDATSATILDTTTYPVADQDGLTAVVTLTGGLYDGVAQTVTFSAATTTAAGVAAQMNAQLDGCSVEVSAGQVKITHDGAGTGMDIATAAGTGGLTWAASTAGTGDVVDIDAVTATEVKTLVEADTTATAEVVGDACVIKATEELDFVSGTALAKLGLSVETLTANENGIPKMVLRDELEGVNGDNQVRPITKGTVRADLLVINDGSTVTKVIRDQLRNYSIVPVDNSDLSQLDNQ